MDIIIHEIRRDRWAALILECNNSGMSKKDWLVANRINEKRFYSWQRKLRAQAAGQMKEQLLPVATSSVAFAEISLPPATETVPVANEAPTVRADRPAKLLRNSVITPSLAAAILNGKYVNALPLFRMEHKFQRNDIHLSRQVMANWVIQCSERYLSLVHDRLHAKMFEYHVLHADETTVEVSKDGRPAGSNRYMWVYQTGGMYEDTIVLYQYQRTRKADHPREFLKEFDGVVVTDGYQVYHKLEAEEDLKVAGCWSHARRRFAEATKGMKKEAVSGIIAHRVLCQIAAIYKLDNELAKLEPAARKERRQLIIRPLVNSYFAWIKEMVPGMSKGKTLSGLEYSLNQEKYLRAFLEDGEILMDNNVAERAIRGFCVGGITGT